MILPQNLPFAAFVLQLSRADRSFSRLDQQLVETPTSLSDSSPCSSVTFLPSVVTEFTEYKCQSVHVHVTYHIYIYLFLCIYTVTNVCIYIHTYMYIYRCMYIYTHLKLSPAQDRFGQVHMLHSSELSTGDVQNVQKRRGSFTLSPRVSFSIALISHPVIKEPPPASALRTKITKAKATKACFAELAHHEVGRVGNLWNGPFWADHIELHRRRPQIATNS